MSHVPPRQPDELPELGSVSARADDRHMTFADARIRAVAARQQGTFSTGQAFAAGMTKHELQHRTRRGGYTRMSRHVLRVTGAPETEQLSLHAALLEAGGRSAVGHGSAAAVWGLTGFALVPAHIVRLRDGTFQDATLGTVHTTRRLPDSHVAERDGMLVTTPTRTLFDLAPHIHAERLENLIDQAWSKRLTDGPLLRRTLHELAGRGQTGIALMRELIAVRPDGYIAPESNLESRFKRLANEAGIAGFRRQVRLGDDVGMIGRVDLWHDLRKVVVEIDSDLHHTSISDRRRDAARQARLEAQGWTVIRITEFELWHQPEVVVSRIRAALSQR